ncbi:MAG: molecular chaperone DnaJ [Bdellovibrionales bacterium CG10_big_fil_rev_8_21_14_0_10_45_34]|nr:MAG: molecular chaperone DnaJ [Bdellovibrionales bacterium CG10_big_fil_rev_8_21_14_0_10_45_34]
MAQDYYEILGVARNADADTIKKAYRKLAMKFHPDQNPGDKAAEDKFKEAAQAYEVLGNADKRSKYDQIGHAAYTQSGMGGQGYGGAGFQDIDDIFASFGDIFGDMFGGGRRTSRGGRSKATRGADLRYRLQIDLLTVLDGGEQEVEFETEDNCKRCSGSGAEPGTAPEVCGTCRGAGQVVRAQGFFSMATTCPTCHGNGQLIKNSCNLCRGHGRVAAKRHLTVKIPPGVRTGTRLRVAGEGEGGFRGGPSGDLYVEIHVKDHPQFERDGDHLISRLKVSYLQAILGAEIQAPALKGSEMVTVPEGSQPADLVKLAHKGLPSLRGGARGDLYYRLEVEIPKKISKDEEKLLREIASSKNETVSEGGNGLFRRR